MGVHISFANLKYYRSLDNLERSSLKIGGVDKFIAYTDQWLMMQEEFEKLHRYILWQKRGYGYWVWKPFIILDALNQMEDGDIVLYTDAGMDVIHNLDPLFDLAEKHDVALFKIGGDHLNRTWTKRDCFIGMNCDEPKYWNSIQLTASYQLWKKTHKNLEILKEYLKFCGVPTIITDMPNIYGTNFLEFKDHRHDQSILTNLSVKHNIKRFRDPSQFGNLETERFEEKYPQMFYHHRKSNEHWGYTAKHLEKHWDLKQQIKIDLEGFLK